LNLWDRPALPETIAANKFPRACPRSSRTKFVGLSGAPLIASPVPVRVPERPHRGSPSRGMVLREQQWRTIMSSIGQVARQPNGSYKGHLKTLAFQAAVSIVPNADKKTDEQPDYRVIAGGVEIGAGWKKLGESSGQEYVSLSLSDPSFGPQKLYANLGRAPGQDDDIFAIIWNPLK
jgi:uncharacterized protein (DUF736 family)